VNASRCIREDFCLGACPGYDVNRMAREIIFFILASIAIGGAAMAVTRQKALSSLVFFTFTLLAVFGLFLQLQAPTTFITLGLAVFVFMMALILFAVETGRLDLFVGVENEKAARFAGWTLTAGVLLEIIAVNVQRRWLPGQGLTMLLPRAPVKSAVSVWELQKDLFNYHGLPLLLGIFVVAIVVIGIKTMSRKRFE
jgi:NADH:ubiquinone oxidoreductase subunit 6 (subunit J)